MNRKAVLAAVRAQPASRYVWDGKSEDDRPATAKELSQVVRGRGRPAGTAAKEQVTVRLDHEVLKAFRDAGAGWQTRMNAALREWLRTHAP